MTTTSNPSTRPMGPTPDDADPDAAAEAEGAGGSAPPGPMSLPAGLLKLARPKQWTKNLLVFAAPGAAGVLDDFRSATHAVIAFVAFCMAAAGTYYINDARDVAADRLHPKKRYRPVATGVVPVQLAFVMGGLLLVGAVGVSFIANWKLAAVVVAYVTLTTSYSAWLKHVAVVDLVAVASGFVLRAVGGAEAIPVKISNWFFIVTIFGSLFMVAGKRGAEAAEMGDDADSFRPVLAAYRPEFTAYLRAVTSGALLVSYCQWAFVKADEAQATHPWYQATILPFVMAVLRYALVLDQGEESAPEEIILGDRILQVIGLLWVAIFAIGVYTTR